VWVIGPEVREKFTFEEYYPIALKQDIPWRQWQAWMRELVTTHCREHNLVNTYNPSDNSYARDVKPMAEFHPDAVKGMTDEKCSLM